MTPAVESSTWPLNSHISSENYPKTKTKTNKLKILATILADFMPTEGLGNQFLLILCFTLTNSQVIIHSCLIPI